MYLQITTVCNMLCPHCMFSCTDCGRHMDMDVVKAACRLVKDYDAGLDIGGGEPTCHPYLFDIIQHVERAVRAVKHKDECAIFLSTNGVIAHRAQRLLDLAEQEHIFLQLSLDQYHDYWRVAENVIERADKLARAGSARVEVSRNRRFLLKAGRSSRGEDDCGSCGIHISPDGSIWRCSCQEERLGTVFDPPKLVSVPVDDLGCSRSRTAEKLRQDPSGAFYLVPVQ